MALGRLWRPRPGAGRPTASAAIYLWHKQPGRSAQTQLGWHGYVSAWTGPCTEGDTDCDSSGPRDSG
eukprot:6265633-Pyramimonas_sp.AAC.1